MYIIDYSAGDGRTGTYIALEYLLAQAEKEDMVDMVECVRKMRTRRPKMIQTEVCELDILSNYISIIHIRTGYCEHKCTLIFTVIFHLVTFLL